MKLGPAAGALILLLALAVACIWIVVAIAWLDHLALGRLRP